MKAHSPAAERNKEPLRAVLEELLPERGAVLEIAAGTGQHAVHFATGFPGVRWYPTDLDPEAIASIEAYRAETSLSNLQPPDTLDVCSEWTREADAIFCANMIHIAPIEACAGLVRGSARSLGDGGLLILYGPFRFGGAFTAPSNAAFDISLRARDDRWGIRDLDDLTVLASSYGFVKDRIIEMPANNHCVVFRRRRG